MDIIKKRINLEAYKSHTPAIIPFIKVYDDGESHIDFGEKDPVLTAGDNCSWGNVACDYMGYSASTADLFAKYFEINAILRRGNKMKRIRKDERACYTELYDDDVKAYLYKIYDISLFTVLTNGTITQVKGDILGDEDKYVSFVSHEDYERYIELGGQSFIDFMEDDVIGLIDIPSYIKGVYVPEKFYISQINKWLEWFSINEAAHNKKDCCDSGEWDKRGGDSMRRFLQENYHLYTAKLDTWMVRLNESRDRVENNLTPSVKAPTLTIPLSLTQNYDDIGTMSVYNENAEYYGNEAGDGQPYEEGVQSESKLQTLRSKIKKYADNGEVLPYIVVGGENLPPYKVGEAFNLAYNPYTQEYTGDFIKSMKYYNDEGEEVGIESATRVDFEYVIGGLYTPSGTISVTTTQKTVSYSGEKIGIKVTAPVGRKWVVMSNCDWFSLVNNSDSIVTGGTGSRTSGLYLSVKENKSSAETRIATVVIATSDDDFEEAICSVLQDKAPSVVNCSFTGSGPNTLTASGDSLTQKLKIVCRGSGWYLKESPDFVTVTPRNGSNGVVTDVTVIFDKYEDSVQRTGNLVFGAVSNGSIAYKVKLTQTNGKTSQLLAHFVSGSQMPTAATINYGSNIDAKVLLETKCGDVTTTSTTSSWNYEVLNQSAATYFTITRESDNLLNLVNKNTSSTDVVATIKVYHTEESSLTTTLRASLIRNKEAKLTLSPLQSCKLEVGESQTFTVSVSGDTSDSWDISHLNTDYSTAEKTGVNRFKVTNANKGFDDKYLNVYAKHKNSDAISSGTTVTMLAAPQYMFNCTIDKSGFSRKVTFEIWPNDNYADKIQMVCGANEKTCTFGPTPISKDSQKKYKIRTNFDSAVTQTAEVELLNQSQAVVWKKTMGYSDSQEFYSNYFESGKNLTIKIKIRE